MAWPLCWGLNTLETVTDAHMKIAHNPLDLVLEARVSELQAVDCALQTFKTEEKKLENKTNTTALKVPGRSLSRVLVEPNPV